MGKKKIFFHIPLYESEVFDFEEKFKSCWLVLMELLGIDG
jgi:hypothetical protein